MQTQTAQTKAVRTFRAPIDYGNLCAFTVTAEVHGEPPYFAVTGDIYNKSVRTRNGDGTQACGCLHDEAAKAWPKIKPIIALHLSDAETGEPMYAEANGYYWLAGVVGGLGEKYHGGSGTSGKSRAECLGILAEHLRIDLAEAGRIANKVSLAYDQNARAPKVATIRAKKTFHDFVNAQRDRWQAEADAGIALIRELSQTNGNTLQG